MPAPTLFPGAADRLHSQEPWAKQATGDTQDEKVALKQRERGGTVGDFVQRLKSHKSSVFSFFSPPLSI